MIGQTARRAFDAAITGSRTSPPAYRPATLRRRLARVYVTVRRRGRVVAEGQSGEIEVLDGARAAAEAAARAAPASLDRHPEALAGLGVEVELCGPDEFVSAGLDEKLHFEQALYDSFEPGMDGVGVALRSRRGRVRASVVVASGYSPPLALQHAESDCGFTARTKQEFKADIRYFRFPCVHIWQPDAFATPIRLYCGLTRLADSDVTAERLDSAIGLLERLVRRRARRDAWFAFEYLPSAEQFSEENSLFGQFQAAAALGRYGRLVGSRPCVEMSERLTAAAQSFAQPLAPNISALAVVSTKDAPPLATTALYLSLVAGFPSAETTVKPAELADAIRLVQDPSSGRFTITFPPEPPGEGRPEAAIYAVQALLDFAGRAPNDDIDRRVRLAVRHYANYLAKLPSRALAAALPPAMTAAYARRPDPPVSDLLLAAGDWLAAQQVRREWRTAQEMLGAIVDPQDAQIDAGTAPCLIALCDAWAMARRLGDRNRETRYAEAVRRAARFVMQLQFRPEECFYLGDSEDVLGGVRRCPWDHRLRVDDSALALLALTRARETLFGGLPATVPGR